MKTAYVTGADRGLGHALTTVLLEKGYKVYAGQYIPEWKELSVLKEKYGEQLIILPLDIADLTQVTHVANVIKENEGSLDILFNNAAIHDFIGKKTIFDMFNEEDYKMMQRIYDVNTLGTLRVTQSVIDLIVKGDSKVIVNISSEAGSIAGNWRNDDYGYCMTKAAINMQSSILQHSVLHLGIKVLAIHPGWLRSYMGGKLNEEATEEPMDVAYSIMNNILGREDLMDLASHIFWDYRGIQMAF